MEAVHASLLFRQVTTGWQVPALWPVEPLPVPPTQLPEQHWLCFSDEGPGCQANGWGSRAPPSSPSVPEEHRALKRRGARERASPPAVFQVAMSDQCTPILRFVNPWFAVLPRPAIKL